MRRAFFYAVIDADRDDLPECDNCLCRASVVRLAAPTVNGGPWWCSPRCLAHSYLDKKDRKQIKRMIEARKGNNRAR